jgi:hypothetical protein
MITIKKTHARGAPPPIKQWKQKTRCLEMETCFLETSFRVEDGEVELYISSFPASSLVLGQIESSVREFADLSLAAAVAGRQPPRSPPPSS